MVETCVGPSDLHLKKELTALRKARFLRDPETSSSWRSPVSSKSFVATSTLNSRNGLTGNLVGKSYCVPLEIVKRGEEKNNKVYLYNWKHRSTKSVDLEVKLDEEDKRLSVLETLEDNLTSHHALDSVTDVYPEFPQSIYRVSGSNSETPNTRSDRNSRRSSNTRKDVINHSAISTLLDIGSRSLGILNSAEQSDDTENCNSEDSRQLKYGLSKRTCYVSRSSSPMFSDSGFCNLPRSSRIFRITRMQGSSQSCTPASTNSFYKYGAQNPSIVDSCDGTTASLDGDELDQPDLPTGQGCGMSCYWSKRTKYRGIGGGVHSPSLSDTLKRKGSSILCGSHPLCNKKRSGLQKQKRITRCSQGLPLLSNSCDGDSSSLDTASDELSTNLGELDLEAVSRLDGRRWSSCKSQEAVEFARAEESDLETEDKRSLSRKYQPMSFDEVIGQNIVIQSLRNAILRGRIAPAYLFQGPRGTGKTSVARIFSAALNCLSTEDKRPCWLCRECISFSSRNRSMNEVNATNHKSLDKFRFLLKNLSLSKSTSQYKVFVIDNCHMMSPKIWSSLLKYLEEPIPQVVFIFIVVNPENLPHSIVSRCQKYIFSKVKDADIVFRLRKISEQENLDVELDALDLIALNSDGSPRDAETMLDQLNFLGKRITSTLVHDLLVPKELYMIYVYLVKQQSADLHEVGVVSDDKLLDLLEIAMSSDNAETIKRSRELLDSGVDPIALMSQLAGLIMDIIAGTYELTNLQIHGTALGKRSLNEPELDRLKLALKVLSDAEKQLRHSSERSTWFTAALLQLGGDHGLENMQSGNNSKKSNKASDGVVSDMVHNAIMSNNRISLDSSLVDTVPQNDATAMKIHTCISPDKLDDIWRRCIDQCHSRTLQQLLSVHGRLVSITDNNGSLVVLLSFEDNNIKNRAERFLSSITNSFELVLSQNVEVQMGLLSKDSFGGLKHLSESPAVSSIGKGKRSKVELDTLSDISIKVRHQETSYAPVKGTDYPEIILLKEEKSDSCVIAGNCLAPTNSRHSAEGKDGSIHRCHKAATEEQRLESAWLQAAEKYTPEFVSHSKPEKNQVLPQNGIICQNNVQSFLALSKTSKDKEDELNHEIQALKLCDDEDCLKEQIGGSNQFALSPSLLHNYGNFDKESQGYESGPGCNGLLCWKTRKANGQKVKQGIRVRSKMTGRLSLLGSCAKPKPIESKSSE